MSSEPNSAVDTRKAELVSWLDGIGGLAGSDPVPASEDASFRRYFRLQTATESFIAMDAPPPQEDCLPFVRVAGYLEAMQLNAPRVIDADLDRGFLLLTDLGRRLYLDELTDNPGVAPSLYADAIDALIVMQREGAVFQASLPPYDEALLRFEMSLFHDWLCATHLAIDLTPAEESAWQALCDTLTDNALNQPQVFVHRDYHSRNLMVTEQGNPGILDFQDAVEGPLTYDLVSLLKDCYVRWPAQDVWRWALQCYGQLDGELRVRIDETLFRRYFELMGVQRHLKAAGIFARLNHRDGKPGYMADVPRTLSYIVELGDDYEELAFITALIAERVLPGLGDGR